MAKKEERGAVGQQLQHCSIKGNLCLTSLLLLNGAIRMRGNGLKTMQKGVMVKVTILFVYHMV